MKIKNIEIKSIEARRYIERNERPKKVRIDHNSTFTRITELEGNLAKVDFQYSSSYGAVGVIKIEGSLLFEENDVKKIADNWNETRKMDDELASKMHTAVMHTCVPQAVGIAKDLGLPPPIPLPQVRLGKDPKKGSTGPEVA